MCGIAGFVGAELGGPDRRHSIVRMLEAIKHRGPDAFGAFIDEQIALGTARLAIIDIPSGHQPMCSPDGRYVLAFNGEIFNYIELRDELKSKGISFRTRSDTEVLLHALIVWGSGALKRLNGQFAFAFHDRKRRHSLLARDSAGERPLFYRETAAGLEFASELKSLFRLSNMPRELDPDMIATALHFWTTLPNTTIFRGIKSIPPGHCLELDDDGCRIARFTPRRDVAREPIEIDEAIHETRTRLTRAVELRMRSDVEVGVYVSGGIDSAITAALARTCASEDKLKSYSVCFEDPSFDEGTFQETAVADLGTEHTSIKVTADDIRKTFPDVVRHAETVQFRTAATPLHLLAEKVHSHGIKVVLTGEGADESFLGYDIFKEAVFLSQFENMADDEARSAQLAQLYPYIDHFQGNQARALVNYYRSFAGDAGIPALGHGPRFANGSYASRLVRDADPQRHSEETFLRGVVELCPEFERLGLLQRTQVLEEMTLLAGYLLSSQGDRMTMAFGVEGRCPFLDPDVTAFSRRLPPELMLRDGVNEKYILKQAFKDIVPREILSRPKQPYRSPGAECFVPDNRGDWLDELISHDQLARSNIVDPQFAQAIIDQVQRTGGKVSPRVEHTYISLLSILLLENSIARRDEDLLFNDGFVHEVSFIDAPEQQ